MYDYFQRDNIEYLKNSYGKEQWIQVAGECSLHNAKASFWCCLFLVDHLKEVHRIQIAFQDSFVLEIVHITIGIHLFAIILNHCYFIESFMALGKTTLR